MYQIIFSILITFFFSCLAYFVFVHNYSRFFQLIKKIPGPPSYPIVGNVLLLHGSKEKTFQLLRKFAKDFYPIFQIYSLNIGSVHLLHPDDVEIVLSNTKYNRKEFPYTFLKQWLGEGLLTSHGPHWINRRKILTSAFHFSILQEFLTVFHEESARLIKTIAEQSESNEVMDVEPLIIEFTLQSMAETSMGVRIDKDTSKGHGDYKKAVNDFTEITSDRIIRPWVYNKIIFNFTSTGAIARRCTKILHEFSRRILKERKEKFENEPVRKPGKRQAMLDLLLTARKNGADIDDEGIREEIDTFMFEGHDTTELAICNTLVLIANNPEVQEQIYREIVEVLGTNKNDSPTFGDYKNLDYTERCIKEALRLCPSVPNFSRINDTEIETATGYTIPKGSLVFISPYDLHRNPEHFPDPEKFDPDRFLPENCKNRHPYVYIPFSAGPRNCIGQKFAMLELKTVLCAILRNFRLEPVDKLEDVFKYPFDLLLRPKNGIKIKFCKR